MARGEMCGWHRFRASWLLEKGWHANKCLNVQFQFEWRMSITSITYTWCSFICCILHVTHYTCMAKWTRAFVNRAICNNVYMWKIHTCHPCSTHISGVDLFPFPSSFYSYECEGVGATSYKKWPMLIMIQLSPLTRYFVRPKKPVHALNISQTAENTLFLGLWFNVRSHSIINFIRKGWETTVRANSIVLNTHACKKPVLKMCYSYKKLSIHIWSVWEMRIMHLWDTLHFHMSMRYRVYYCVWVRNAAKKLSFDKKLGTGLL